MPSSTSSSDRVIPGGSWGATWLLALSIAIGLTWYAERAVRAVGQRPSVTDDPVTWSVARRSVDDDPSVVAFVGTSRMQLAYSTSVFRALMPERRGVQLAINGVPAIEILADLADDPRFRGSVVVDLDELDIAWGDPFHSARPYVKRAHALWRAPGQLANRWLGSFAQERLALLAIGGRASIVMLARGWWPAPTLVSTDRERTSRANYSLAEPAMLRAKARKRYSNFDAHPPSPTQWLEQAHRLDDSIRRIQARGGKVLLIRLPVSGKLAELFARDYPRALYWDAYAAASPARAVYFADVPALRDLACPDEMHLDGPAQDVATRVFADLLRDGR